MTTNWRTIDDLNMVSGASALWAGVSSPSLIDIEISDEVTGEMTSFTLGTIEAVSLADWLNAWIKTQQWQPEDVTTRGQAVTA